jgi:hypothetical protein
MITLDTLNKALLPSEESVDAWITEHLAPHWDGKSEIRVKSLPTTKLSIEHINSCIMYPRGLEICKIPLSFKNGMRALLFNVEFERTYYVIPYMYQDDE